MSTGTPTVLDLTSGFEDTHYPPKVSVRGGDAPGLRGRTRGCPPERRAQAMGWSRRAAIGRRRAGSEAVAGKGDRWGRS